MTSFLDISNPTTRRALSVAKALVKKRHQVSLIVPATYGMSNLRGLIEKKDGVTIYHSRYYRRPLSTRAREETLQLPDIIARAIDMLHQSLEVDFDVIHAFKPLIGASIGCVTRLLKAKPLLIDVDDWEGKGGYADFYPYFTGLMEDIFERTTPKHCDAVTAASVVLAQRVRECGVKAERIFYIPNGVDPERFRPGDDECLSPNALPQNSQTFVYSGAILKFYDLDLLISAFRKVVGAYPAAKCLIGGEGAERAALESLTRKIGLEKSVIFTGWIPDRDYPSFLARADIFVVPVRDRMIHRAACHGKIIEYMSMGRPVITGRTSEAANYIEHMRSGYLVEPGNIEALSNAMIELLQNRHLAEYIGKNARKRVIERYTWDIIASKFEKVYEQLV